MIVAHVLRVEPEITKSNNKYMSGIPGMAGYSKYTYDDYVYNAMSLIPAIMLSPVDELSVGALLCIVSSTS